MLPSAFVSRIQVQLGDEASDFFKSMESFPPVSIRLNPLKPLLHPLPSEPIPWCKEGAYLAERPSFTLDPTFHAGAYYVQEASSMFLSEVLRQKTSKDKDYTVLDLCAAPGGKTTLIASELSPNSVILANETISKRAGLLMENTIKWGLPNVMVSQNEPADFGRLKETFDIIVVDAPCSGEGMFRKDPNAVSEWTEHAASFCAQRQETILDQILPCLKPGGILIYSTCTFAEEENEKISDYLIHKQGLIPDIIKTDPNWGISRTGTNGLRFYPHKVKGEGLYMSCFTKPGTMEEANLNRRFREKPLPLESHASWLNVDTPTSFVLFNEASGVIARNQRGAILFDQFNKNLRFKKSGLLLGKSAGKDFIPDHELAVSVCSSKSIERIEVDKQMALNYLKKENFNIDIPNKGWCLVTHQGLGLGWIKSMGNRLNNYYPTEWRIRMRLEL